VRVLLVSGHGADPAFGGAERYVGELAAGLAARGHSVKVLSAFPQRGEPRVETEVLHRTDWRDDPVRRLRNHLGDVVSAPWPGLAAVLRASPPDLVHTNNLPGIGSGIWEVARRAGTPVVHTLLDYHLLCPRTTLMRRDGQRCNPHPLLCGLRTRRLMRWQGAVRAVIGVSGHILGVHRGLFQAAAERVVPMPLKPLSGPPPEPLSNPPATIGYIGALTPTKGIGVLLEAAPALAGAGLTVRVAGDGPLRSAVESAEEVRYDGRLEGEELGAFVGSCDLGVVPSLWDEPGPYVVAEWLAAGRPVIATRRGGLAEAEERGGVIAFDESAEGLVRAALRLCDRDSWTRLVATLPRVDGDSAIQDWLDAHEAAYAAALERARA
jgi:glycosyltransferase involved in cell wall biosynthesis